jgi:citrate lyase subunit beta/citryl-CoA lyase
MPDNANPSRIIRTMAFVPAQDTSLALAAADTGLDCVGMDLEDLTPKTTKQTARDIFKDTAKALAARGVIVTARTNGFEEGMCEADLEAIVCPELHFVNMPKAESAKDVERFCDLLSKAEEKAGLPVGYTWVRPVIETSTGIRLAYEIAAASERVEYMGGVAGGFWGDLGATLGTIYMDDGRESLYLRSKVLVDARSAGLRFPVGGGAIAKRTAEAARSFALENKHLGYTGMFTQPVAENVAAINDVFTPTKDEVADWIETIPLLETALAEGRIAFRQGDRMYDVAGLQRVKEQVELATRLGLVN